MKIQPKNGMLFIQQLKAKDQSDGGIVLPESAKKAPTNDGVITHVHPDVKDRYEVGQRVIFGEYSGAPIAIGDEVYIAMVETEIIAVIEDDPIFDDDAVKTIYKDEYR